MRIGVLTYHRVVNDGSTLQVYCTQKLLSRLLPHARVEIVDYWGMGLQIREWLFNLRRKPPFFSTSRLRKSASQQHFLRNECAFSATSCMSDRLAVAGKFLEAQGYDAIFVGSDTVWEVRKGGGGPFPPNVYFLSDVRGPKKVAWAVSSSKTAMGALDDPKLRSLLRKSVEDFDEITARDTATSALIRDLGIDPARVGYMPDPTIVGDFPVLPRERILGDGERIAGLSVKNPRLRGQLARLLDSMGYDVVNFIGPVPEKARGMPEGLEFLSRVSTHRELALFVTDRFHGSIFTFLQCDAPVVLIEEKSLYPTGQWKGRDLYSRIGAQEMIAIFDEKDFSKADFALRIEKWGEVKPRVKSGLAKLQQEGRKNLQEILTRQGLFAQKKSGNS